MNGFVGTIPKSLLRYQLLWSEIHKVMKILMTIESNVKRDFQLKVTKIVWIIKDRIKIQNPKGTSQITTEVNLIASQEWRNQKL